MALVNLGDMKMKRTLLFALAMASLLANAHAADTNAPPSNSPFQLNPAQFKDPLPDSLTFWGVTFYATLDLGYAYQTNGRPLGSWSRALNSFPSRPPGTTPVSTSRRLPTAVSSNPRSE